MFSASTTKTIKWTGLTLCEIFAECFPGAVLPCSRCRCFAVAFSMGSSDRLMASISLGRKSLRCAFSASAPRIMFGKSTTQAGTVLQPRARMAAKRRSPAISVLSELTTMGCSKLISAMFWASP